MPNGREADAPESTADAPCIWVLKALRMGYNRQRQMREETTQKYDKAAAHGSKERRGLYRLPGDDVDPPSRLGIAAERPRSPSVSAPHWDRLARPTGPGLLTYRIVPKYPKYTVGYRRYDVLMTRGRLTRRRGSERQQGTRDRARRPARPTSDAGEPSPRLGTTNTIRNGLLRGGVRWTDGDGIGHRSTIGIRTYGIRYGPLPGGPV